MPPKAKRKADDAPAEQPVAKRGGGARGAGRKKGPPGLGDTVATTTQVSMRHVKKHVQGFDCITKPPPYRSKMFDSRRRRSLRSDLPRVHPCKSKLLAHKIEPSPHRTLVLALTRLGSLTRSAFFNSREDRRLEARLHCAMPPSDPTALVGAAVGSGVGRPQTSPNRAASTPQTQKSEVGTKTFCPVF